MKNINRLVIGNLNINSISKKFDQLKTIIQGHIDILIIVETKLDATFPINQFLLDGFSKPFRLDRNRNGGGILIYVREDIPTKQLFKHNFPSDIEGIFVEINLRKTKWLLFGTYHPPSQTDNYYFESITRALDIYGELYSKLLLVGDFNAEDSESCMSSFLYQHNLKNLVKQKTCFKSTENPSCIDLFLTNCAHSFKNTNTISAGISDCHKMVVTVLKTTFTKAKPKKIFYRSYKNFNNSSFLEHKYYKHPSAENNKTYKKQKNFCSRLYKKERKKFYANIDIRNVTDNKKFWQTVKPLFSGKSQNVQQITIIKDGEILSKKEEVAETLNNYFKNAVRLLDISENKFLLTKTNEHINSIDFALKTYKSHPSILNIRKKVSKSNFSFQNVTISEIENELQKLNSKKSSTLNNIPTKILKSNKDICSSTLHMIFNESLNNSSFPDELKLADITTIFKKEDATFEKNYRPVSVLPVVSKIFERLLQTQINSYFEKYLTPHLCGYRKGYNTRVRYKDFVTVGFFSLRNYILCLVLTMVFKRKKTPTFSMFSIFLEVICPRTLALYISIDNLCGLLLQ